MKDSKSWSNLWKRTRRQVEIKLDQEEDFPRDYWTADEILDNGLYKNLEKVAEDLKKSPEPTDAYRAGARLEAAGEEVILGRRGLRSFTGGVGGMAAGNLPVHKIPVETAASSNPVLAFASVIGGGITGTAVLGGGDLAASAILEKTGEKIKSDPDNLQGISEEPYGTPVVIGNHLSDRDGGYAFKTFGENEWVEKVDREEIEEFLTDLSYEAETDWRVKRKEDHPLQVVGIHAEYSEDREDIYSDRIRIAEDIAEEENMDIEEILDVNEDTPGIEPAPTEERYEQQETYEFAVVDTNPEYSFEIENDFRDYSEILETDRELEKLRDNREKATE